MSYRVFFVGLVVVVLAGAGLVWTAEQHRLEKEDRYGKLAVLVAIESVPACVPYDEWSPAFEKQWFARLDILEGALLGDNLVSELVPKRPIAPGEQLRVQLLVKPTKCPAG